MIEKEQIKRFKMVPKSYFGLTMVVGFLLAGYSLVTTGVVLYAAAWCCVSLVTLYGFIVYEDFKKHFKIMLSNERELMAGHVAMFRWLKELLENELTEQQRDILKTAFVSYKDMGEQVEEAAKIQFGIKYRDALRKPSKKKARKISPLNHDKLNNLLNKREDHD